MDTWRMTRLSMSYGPVIYRDDIAGDRLEVPADSATLQRWQRAAETCAAEVAAAIAERDAARKALPERRFWWTPGMRRRAAWDVHRQAEQRFAERIDAATEAYRPHGTQIEALLEEQRAAERAAYWAERQRVTEAFGAWHRLHDGRRTLAEAHRWQATDALIDVGGGSDAYTLAKAVPGPVRWTPSARAAVESATGADADDWWAWVGGTVRNLDARRHAVTRLRTALAATTDTLREAGFPGAGWHVLDSSPQRPKHGWVVRFDEAALRPPPLPMPPADVLSSGTFTADVFVYGTHNVHVFTTTGEFAWTAAPSNWYLRSQRQWQHNEPAWFAGMILDARLLVHGLPGHNIRHEYPVTHLLPPDAYIPYIDAASDLIAETVRALA